MSILNKIDFKNLSTKHLTEIVYKSKFKKEKKTLLTNVIYKPVNWKYSQRYKYKNYIDKDLYELQIVLCLFLGWPKIYNNIHPSLAKNLSLLCRTIKKIELKVDKNTKFYAWRDIFSSEPNFSPILNRMLTLLWCLGSKKVRQQLIKYFNLKPTSIYETHFDELPIRFIKENQNYYKRLLIEHMKKYTLHEFYMAPDFIKYDELVIDAWLSRIQELEQYHSCREFLPKNIFPSYVLIEELHWGMNYGNKRQRNSFKKQFLTQKKVIEKVLELISLQSNKTWLGTFFKKMRATRGSDKSINGVYESFERNLKEILAEYFNQDIIFYEIINSIFIHKIQNPELNLLTAQALKSFFQIEDIILGLKEFDALNINALKYLSLFHASGYESSNPFVAVHIQKLIDDKEKRKSIEMNKYNISASNILFAKNNHMKFNKKYVSEDKNLDFIIKKNTSIATSMSSLK